MDYKVSKIKLDKAPAFEKIKDWCAYQERSQHQARQKLYSYGLHQNEVEEMLAQLISENFINEERFANVLAGGKFRIKGWGKQKIRTELKKHRITDPCIEKALSAINEKDYQQTLEKLTLKKAQAIGGGNQSQKTASLYRYLVTKGFEPALVIQQLKKLKLNTDEFGIEE